MKHYFQPGREDFRRTLVGKMPALLVGGVSKIEPLNLADVRDKLDAIDETNWRAIRDELVARLSSRASRIAIQVAADGAALATLPE